MISRAGKLIMCVDNPQVVLDSIPQATLKEWAGKRLVIVPHVADTVKILNNLGLKTPSLELDFDYTGRYKPFEHQRKAVEFLVMHKRAFNLSDMGTGKTSAALWAAEYLMQRKKVKRVLIVCPLSVLSVWEEESFTTLPHRSFCKLTGTRERRLDILSKGSEICAINHDGVGTILDALKSARFDLIVDDEASAHRNSQTRRYKQFRDLAKQTPWVWLMTGTPAPKAPTDAYGLIKLVDPTSFPGSFTLFKELTMAKVGMFKWIPKADSKEFIYKHMRPAVRFKKDDCLDLPPITYVNRTCELTEAQKKAFNLMKQKLLMEKEDGERITAANAAVKLIKLLQICCGVVRDNYGEIHSMDARDRLETLRCVLEEAGGKVIIFVPFVAVMAMIKEFLVENDYSTAIINGSVTEINRTKIFNEFQNGDLQCLVAHPQTASHGLNLTASATIVWFAPIFSVEQYLQANNRISRPGQTKHMTIAHILSTPLEAGLYRALWGKIQMQNAILSQYEDILK